MRILQNAERQSILKVKCGIAVRRQSIQKQRVEGHSMDRQERQRVEMQKVRPG